MVTKTDRSIALALDWARTNAGEHAAVIENALAAYDPERVGARTASHAAQAPERRPITDEDVDVAAKAVADVIGHGMREKCYGMARAALESFATVPASAPTLCEVTDKDSRSASFERIARPLIQWLCKNMHPHCSVIVTPTGAELRDGPDHGLHEGLTMNLHNEMLNLLQRIGLRFESGNATPFARAHITHEEWNALLALFSQPMNLCDGPAAARYDFDGFGWQYIDNGSGSGWASRIEGAELLYTRLKPEPVVGKSVPVTLISTIDDGDDA